MESLPPYDTAHSASAVGMFNTATGKLQRHLRQGEYHLFKDIHVFEGDFIQVTQRGELVDIHNRFRAVTVAIASTSPILPLPDVMLLARPTTGCEEGSGRGQDTKGKGRKASTTLELTRLLPLKFVRISIHNREKQQLRLKFATGRSCYLQLSPPLDAREDLFPAWEKLIYLLWPPADGHSSSDATPAEDVFQEHGRNPAGADCQGKGDQDQVSVRSLHEGSEVAGATSAAFAGGEETSQDPPQPNTTPTGAAPTAEATGLCRESAAGARTRAAAAGEAEAAAAALPAGTAAEFAAGEAGIGLAFAGTGAAGEPAGEAAPDGAEGQLLSDAPSSAGSGEPPARPPRKGLRDRRQRRERREKKRAPRSSRHRRAAESSHKAPGNEITPKASSRSLGGRRAAREDEDHERRSGPARGRRAPDEGTSPAPVAKEPGTSHKSGRGVSAGSSGSRTQRLGGIRGFLRSLRARLTARSAASPRGRAVDVVARTADRRAWRPSPRRRRAATASAERGERDV